MVQCVSILISNFTKKNVDTLILQLIFSCGRSNLNGVRYTDPKPPIRAHGMMWYHWLGDHYSLKSSTMIIMSKKGSFKRLSEAQAVTISVRS